ncbi:NUDIX hydrolase [Streptomyces albicerus]|uniref:NUDIX hydrolase n=1 Tax=Streptomyces albicerus TaxID=2569859 RepID=UPI00124B5662|nr:NUDIX hydrolase [Streptomyces albicerus]
MTAGEGSARAYEAFRRSRPELFRNEAGGFEIVSGAAAIRAARRQARVRAAERLARGSRARYWWARLLGVVRRERVGVVSADPFLYHLRDPVRFPDGTPGLYNRIVPPPDATPGIVVLPLLGPENRVVLIEHYRHATREWHWEAVRGFGEPGASGDDNVARELGEELGARPGETIPLGEVHPDTGLLAHRVELFAARVGSLGEPQTSEGIRSAITVSIAEAEEMVGKGAITDGFTIALLYRARLAGLFDTGTGRQEHEAT